MLCSAAVVKNKQTRPRFLVLEKFITCLPPEKPRDIAFIPSVLKRVPPSPDTARLISAKLVFATSLLSEHLGHSTIFGLAFDTVKSGIADLMSYLVKFVLL